MAAYPYLDYTNAVADAKKTLGKDGDLPKPRVDIGKAWEEAFKVSRELLKQRGEVEKTAVEVQTAMAKVKAAAKLYGDMIDGNDFGLDSKDAKQKKIIADVTKTMLDGLKGFEDFTDMFSDRMDKLERVLTDLSRLP
jgi:hypothetical protein